ncbi:hypothetical protein ACFPT7_12205 [Acidicapsa dinghuensis]|uniref:Uncharacterized protein n=1 Tax=Acidicapsa dinghuensis TaxID=2218256 RepID=A0ABW1EFF1_9BACT|nr:hypothetical protein [Acidicapsa dinghuensis]
MTWEQVYTINDWWDCPRLGVADVHDVPHIYESPFDPTLDDYSDFYLVSPIRPELPSLVLEDWEIWKRWSNGFDNQTASRENHPALPEDRARHEQIEREINGQLVTNPALVKKLYATFRRTAPGWSGFEVEWNEKQL